MKPGFVYVGESTRKDGSKKMYTGMTCRSPRVRWGEHIASVKSEKSKSWVGKGTHFKPMGAVYSRNPRKAEATIKRMTSTQKRNFGHFAARKYYNK